MFYSYNYFRQYNNMNEIDDYKEFYKYLSNEREFGGAYTNFDHLIKNRFMNFFGLVNNTILRVQPSSILDIGCGNGVNLPFSNLYPHIKYVAVDYAEKAAKTAQETFPKAEVHTMDAFNLNFKDEMFDMVIISSVLILYKEEADRIKILAEAKRVLKPGGCLLLITWKDSPLLKFSVYLSRVIARLRNIPLPQDFCGVYFKDSEINCSFEKLNLKLNETLYAGLEFGLLESVRYLNMGKYRRKFGAAEKEIGQKIPLNVLEDLKSASGSPLLMTIFYQIGQFFPSAFQMYTLFVLNK